VLFRQFQELLGVKLGHQHRGAAVGDGRQIGDQRGVRIERGGDHRHRGVGIDAAADLAPAHGMRLDDALGRAGGARRIDDVEALVGGDRHRSRLGAFGGQPLLEGHAGVGAVQRHALGLDAARHAGQRIGHPLVEEEDLGPAVLEHDHQALGRGAGGERGDDAAGPQDAEEGRAVFGRGGGADGGDVGVSHAFALQADRDAVHQGVELGVGDGALGVDQGGLGALLLGLLADHVRQGSEILAQDLLDGHGRLLPTACSNCRAS